jgi:hypothetical protein
MSGLGEAACHEGDHGPQAPGEPVTAEDPEHYQMLTKELQLSSIRIAPGCFRRRCESAGTRKLNGIQHEKHMTSGLNGDEIAIGGRSSSG